MDNTLFNPAHQALPDFLERLKNEYEAFFFYRSASSFCATKGYTRAQKFFDDEAYEELSHAKQIERFLNDWGCEFQIPNVIEGEVFSSLQDVIKKSYDIEVALYKKYNENAKSQITKDMSCYNQFQFFVTIQRESIATFRYLLDKISLIDTRDTAAMQMFEIENFNQ